MIRLFDEEVHVCEFLSRRQGHRYPVMDVGYLAHLWIMERWGRNALRPFVVRACDDPESIRLTGVILKDVFADGREARRLQDGMRVSGDVWFCPIKRGRVGRGPIKERDAWGGEGNRESLYADWLRKRLEGFDVDSVEILSVRDSKMLRRGRKGESRPNATITLPDVHARFVGRVADSKRASDTVRRGVGRHKAYGFGYVEINKP